jgi:hypothetical protein
VLLVCGRDIFNQGGSSNSKEIITLGTALKLLAAK